MLTAYDLNLFSTIYEKELMAVKSVYINHCRITLCRHYLEDTLLYPLNKNNDSFFTSAIPVHAKPHRLVRDFIYEIIAIDNKDECRYLTFHEYLYHTWTFFEKAVFNNIPYCLDNYDIPTSTRSRMIGIYEFNDDHLFLAELKKISEDLFVDIFTTVMNLDFQSAMEKSYGHYSNSQLGLRAVLRYRRLPPTYQAFLQEVFTKPPSFISFRCAENDVIVTWSLGDDVNEYVTKCLRHTRRIQHQEGVIVTTNRSALSMGSDSPVRIYDSIIFRARKCLLQVADKKTEVYQSSRLPSGAVKASLLKKA